MLTPFRLGKPFQVTSFDYKIDSSIDTVWTPRCAGAILVFDGIFPYTLELDDWDFSVLLKVGLTWECGVLVNEAEPRRVWRGVNWRYVEGQRIYLQECGPEKRVSVVIGNECVEVPTIEWIKGGTMERKPRPG
jgi:uridine kinase